MNIQCKDILPVAFDNWMRQKICTIFKVVHDTVLRRLKTCRNMCGNFWMLKQVCQKILKECEIRVVARGKRYLLWGLSCSEPSSCSQMASSQCSMKHHVPQVCCLHHVQLHLLLLYSTCDVLQALGTSHLILHLLVSGRMNLNLWIIL